MASKSEQNDTASVGVEDLLLALIALEVDKRERSLTADQVKTELLLSTVGLGHQQIAKIMGKNPDAVRMMISRSKVKPAPKKVAKAGE